MIEGHVIVDKAETDQCMMDGLMNTKSEVVDINLW